MQNEYVSRGGYIFNKGEHMVKKIVNGKIFKRSINSTRDALRYRLFSLRCLLSIVRDQGFSLYHLVPTDMHEYNIKFRSTNNKNDILFYKLYFYSMLLEIQKKYTQFDYLIDQIKKSNTYRNVYSEYDRIFKDVTGLNSVWFGLLISLEIYIHNCTDRLISLDIIKSVMNDPINKYIMEQTENDNKVMFDSDQLSSEEIKESLGYSPKTVESDLSSVNSDIPFPILNYINNSCNSEYKIVQSSPKSLSTTEHTTVNCKQDSDNTVNNVNTTIGKTDIDCVNVDEMNVDGTTNSTISGTVSNVNSNSVNSSGTNVIGTGGTSSIKDDIINSYNSTVNTPCLCIKPNERNTGNTMDNLIKTVGTIPEDKQVECYEKMRYKDVKRFQNRLDEQSEINNKIFTSLNFIIGEIASLKKSLCPNQVQYIQSTLPNACNNICTNICNNPCTNVCTNTCTNACNNACNNACINTVQNMCQNAYQNLCQNLGVNAIANTVSNTVPSAIPSAIPNGIPNNVQNICQGVCQNAGEQIYILPTQDMYQGTQYIQDMYNVQYQQKN